ncbi:tellurite resistance/C4-dicarboxylate transporter family protein [Humibacter sp.]|uniref:tellurite resistance/C4-dicarboxylate transporter family protein n=1 Tax=Humibacter sp. TaxID=1940291 RepID=UPI003F7FAB54
MANPDSETLEPLPNGRVGAWLAAFDPGYFAAVMATGIVSVGAELLGFILIARILLVCTIIAFIVLGTAYVARAIRFPRRFTQSLVSPNTAVTYFTLVAGTNVLGVALLPLGVWVVSLLLGLVAFAIWLVLTYGLFCSIVLAGNRPRLREINGIWLVWVVGTQSVAVLATALAPSVPQRSAQQVLEVTGLLFWGVGVVLYLVLVIIIFLRLLTIETTPAEMGPAYWILMGATAISVRAAAGILAVTSTLPMPPLDEMRPFIIGFSVVLWAFGSWFIPMLVLFGLWRYFVHGYPWSYEPKIWSVVFPLGMYTVASLTLGRAIDFEFMIQLATVWVWIGVGAWCLVVVLMVLALVKSLRSGHTPDARG